MSEETIDSLKNKLDAYEQNGPAKLFYALNRKMVEMADLLNSKNLRTIAIDDPKDKTFDRLKVIWNDSSELATAVQALGAGLGLTGNEDDDVKRKRSRTTPESIAEQIGDNKREDV